VFGDVALLVDPDDVHGVHREGVAGGGHARDEAALIGAPVGGPDSDLVAGRDHVVDFGGWRYAGWPTVTRWVRDQVGQRARLVPLSATVRRVDAERSAGS